VGVAWTVAIHISVLGRCSPVHAVHTGRQLQPLKQRCDEEAVYETPVSSITASALSTGYWRHRLTICRPGPMSELRRGLWSTSSTLPRRPCAFSTTQRAPVRPTLATGIVHKDAHSASDALFARQGTAYVFAQYRPIFPSQWITAAPLPIAVKFAQIFSVRSGLKTYFRFFFKVYFSKVLYSCPR